MGHFDALLFFLLSVATAAAYFFIFRFFAFRFSNQKAGRWMKLGAGVVLPSVAAIAFAFFGRVVARLFVGAADSNVVANGMMIGLLLVFLAALLHAAKLLFPGARAWRMVGAFFLVVCLNVLFWLILFLPWYVFEYPLISVEEVYEAGEGRLRPGDLVYAEPRNGYAKGDKVLVAVWSDSRSCVYDVRTIVALPGEELSSETANDIQKGVWHRQAENVPISDKPIVILSDTPLEGHYLTATSNGEGADATSVVADRSVVGVVKFLPSRSFREKLDYVGYILSRPSLFARPKQVACKTDSSAMGRARILTTFNAFSESRRNELSLRNKASWADLLPRTETGQWKEYSNDVLGISFRYPAEWGKVMTGPAFVTDIARLARSRDVPVTIWFADGPDPSPQIRIIGNDPAVKDHQEGDPTAEYFRHSSDVCELPSLDSLRYVERRCYPGVREALIESLSIRDDRAVGYYSVNLTGYRRIGNDIADHVVVSQQLSDPSRPVPDHLLENMEGFSERFGEYQYAAQRDRFVSFVNSIRSIPVVYPRFEAAPSEWKDDASVRLIVDYYRALNDGDLEKAYAFKHAGADYNVFRTQYENVYKTVPRDFSKRSDGAYEFFVDYQDHNESPVAYHVLMRVEDGKIRTLSSERIDEEVVYDSGLSAAVKRRGNTNFVLAYKNGREIVVGQSTKTGEEEWTADSFRGLRFSADGRFLEYSGSGWEWFYKRIYDLKTEKEVVSLSSPNRSDFTKDGKFYYACALSHFGGELYVDIYSVPDFKRRYAFFEVHKPEEKRFYEDLNCRYDARRSVLELTLSSSLTDQDPSERELMTEVWEYDFSQGKERRIR
jgi:hypothetical protein